jgi:D-alanyl-D-alanine-carboxypeptidase/D-alanyl-D-alanine-endopeptidase
MLVACSGTGARAQQGLSIDGAVARGATLFEQSAATGMVLVVVRNREVAVMSYGETFPGSGRRPDSKSLIRLCSVSKILTSDLLMKLSAEGKVRLDDPLQRFAPPGKKVPQRTGAPAITLLDLATHTSGLPREVGPYPPQTPHFIFPDQTFRWTWLPRQKLFAAPGSTALYSNVGYDLLGDALASASGKTYAQLLHERIIGPLGLHDTTLTPTKDQCLRLLRGTGDEGPCTDTQASGASGGAYSTAEDMVRLLQYLLQVPGARTQPKSAFAVYRKPAEIKSVQGLSHAGDPSGIGAGWIQLGDSESPSMLMQKTGGGAGFETYVALSLKRQTGLFLALTDGKGHAHIDPFHEANVLLADLANVPPLPARVRKAHPSGKHKRNRLQPLVVKAP